MADPLGSYDILQRESGIDRRTGEWYGVRVLSLTAADVVSSSVQALISESIDNKWPDTSGVYAPCIHRCNIVPFPNRSGFYRATLEYCRPKREMILLPGRALLGYDSYSTTLTKEIAVFRDRRELTIYANIPPADWAMYTVTLERKPTLVIEERGLVVIDAADLHTAEATVYQRATDWIGKGGSLLIATRGNPTLEFLNLKCSKVEIQRRATDLSIIDSRFHFAQNPKGWRMEGIIQEEWYACDPNGVPVPYDPYGSPPVIPSGSYMAVKLQNMDSDVISGYADFSPLVPYFSWQDER